MKRLGAVCWIFMVALGFGTGCGEDEGGAGGRASVTPGLWVGEMGSLSSPNDGWAICLYVSPEGDRLMAAEACSVDPNTVEPRAAQLIVENAGVSSGNDPCSFSFNTDASVPIDPDGSFTVGMEDGAAMVVLSGTFGPDSASGMADAQGLPIIDRCTLAEWAAMPAN